MKRNNIIIVVIIVIVVAIGGFFAGMKYQQMQRSSAFAGRFGGAGGGGYRQFGGGARGANTTGTNAVRGQIMSISNGTMTIKLPDGSSKIVVISGSTNISKQATGSTSDLKAGSNVMVLGTTNSDGTVTASMVALNPMMGRGAGGTPPSQPTSGSGY